MKKLLVLILLISFTATCIFYACLKPSLTKIGERTFYKNTDLELKVVLINQNYPFHYVGPGYSVACKSENTGSFPEWKFDLIEAGWNRLPSAFYGSLDENLDRPLLDRLVDRAKELYQVQDNSIVVVNGLTFVSATFDKCKTLVGWNVDSDLPSEFIVDSTPEYDECLKQIEKDKTAGLTSYGDCKTVKFTGANLPIIQDIKASKDGSISFRLKSPALKHPSGLVIQTKNFGKSWTIEEAR